MSHSYMLGMVFGNRALVSKLALPQQGLVLTFRQIRYRMSVSIEGCFFKIKSEYRRFVEIDTLPTASDQIEARAGPSVRSFAPAWSPGIESQLDGSRLS